MGRYNARIVYIDGFAGPGRYSKGEEGSPLIAIKAVLDHPIFQNPQRKGEVVLLFIESETDRCGALKDELAHLEEERPFPRWLKYEVKKGQFDEEMTELLNSIDQQSRQLAPTFIFIDPFGYKGLPLDLIARIVRNPQCECLINFMYESFTRHAGKPLVSIQDEFDQLFGTTAWRQILKESDPRSRYHKAVELYRTQLVRKAGLRYVRTFAMYDRFNQPEYVLFFGTNNKKGLSQMKHAMWKADPLSGRVFSDWTDTAQRVLFEPGSELGLRFELQKQFRGKGFIPMKDIIEFVLVGTAYSEEMHLKMKTLMPMEEETPPLIEVQRPPGAKRRTYPEGTRIKFL